ncbi:MAG: DNA repair protein RadA [Endomicrobiales bacterium]|nr:DNA repair protein RadA [Endomicrobiales bacterium]
MKASKIKTIFRCQNCGYSSAKWLGRCPDCGGWNTLTEEQQQSQSPSKFSRNLTGFSSEVMPLGNVSTADFKRVKTGIFEFDRMLGGGIVPGSIILLGGTPGIGKSTLMLQVSEALSKDRKVLYVSGEESPSQIKSRADRLSLKASGVLLASETNLENILEAVKNHKPEVVIVDSIQTIYRSDLSGAPGSVGQVRECAAEFLRIAKSRGVTVFLLGHVTKEGDLAGPRVLEHIVDTVLYFETERQQVYRILRAFKNRFGPTSEIGIFEMGGEGLKEVKNPSQIFLGERSSTVAGNVVVPAIEGTRPLLLEVQALVSRTNFGFPKRMVQGYDTNKVTIIIAVLEKRVGLHLETQDVFVNIAGGVKIKEPGAELGIACAIASGNANFICPPKTVILGEVGLAGEVRSISQVAERLSESEKLGFEKAIVPKSNLKSLNYKGKIEILGVETVQQAIEQIK